MKRLELDGQKFNMLTVIKKAEDRGTRTFWECKCDCGKIKEINTSQIVNGKTKSCGCLMIAASHENVKKMHKANVKYSPEESSARTVWRRKYSDAGLSFDDFLKLSKMDCWYCGESPGNCYNVASSYGKKFTPSNEIINNGYFTYNGLDRVDNTIGHSIDNVVPCCFTCNSSKRTRTKDDYIKWIEKSYNYMKEKGILS